MVCKIALSFRWHRCGVLKAPPPETLGPTGKGHLAVLDETLSLSARTADRAARVPLAPGLPRIRHANRYPGAGADRSPAPAASRRARRPGATMPAWRTVRSTTSRRAVIAQGPDPIPGGPQPDDGIGPGRSSVRAAWRVRRSPFDRTSPRTFMSAVNARQSLFRSPNLALRWVCPVPTIRDTEPLVPSGSLGTSPVACRTTVGQLWRSGGGKWGSKPGFFYSGSPSRAEGGPTR